MEANWAAEHLQTIRTLMERSALYRRALAPIMIFNGILGVLGALAGWGLGVDSARGFVLFWSAVAFVALAGSFMLVRRQALKDAEPFWSPPARRVVQAILPPLFAGLAVGLFVLISQPRTAGFSVANISIVVADNSADISWAPLAWVVLYGCALHAAGFFTPRGLRLFGWIFVLGGSVGWLCLPAVQSPSARPQQLGYLLMGGFFGVLHLAYGAYLYFTEKGKNAV